MPAMPPTSETQAVEWLTPFLEPNRVRNANCEELLRAWNCVFFLYPGLHPDEAPNEQTTIRAKSDHIDRSGIPNLDPRFVNPYDGESGWPVALIYLGSAVRSLMETSDITLDQFYADGAQSAGNAWRAMKNRLPEWTDEEKAQLAAYPQWKQHIDRVGERLRKQECITEPPVNPLESYTAHQLLDELSRRGYTWGT